MKRKRIEYDSLGSKKIDANRLWGAQTQRSIEYFRIGIEKIPNEIIIVRIAPDPPARDTLP